jgi:predicted double-glycine peptidase
MVLRSTISQILGAGSIAAALMLQSSPLFAAPFGNVIPGAGVLNIPVRSVVGMHFIHVVRQHTDFSCGAASLATILKYGFGQDVTEESVMKGLFTVCNPEEVKTGGFSLLELQR